jgi:hypothetical protein
MDLEEQLRQTYAERLEELDVAGGDIGAARRTGARLRARRRLTVGAAAVALVAVAVGGAVLRPGGVSPGPSDGGGHWRELPAPPLSPRADAQGVWTGHEVILLGGQSDPCGPGADCSVASLELRDGAAYDPGADTWRPIADAPVPVGPGDRLVSAGGRVVLRHWRQGGSDWFVYDAAADQWSRISGVPHGIGDLPSALGPDVYALVGGQVAVYDVVSDRWSTLPPDRMEPRLRHRRVTATSAGPVVTGYDSTQPDDGRSPSVVLADVWDGDAWHRLPPTDQVDNNGWFWTGARMVDPDPTRVDGGETDPFPHDYPAGGILDPSTGHWQPLPDAVSDSVDGGWGLNAQGGRWSATYGQVFDTELGRVRTLPRPEGAPDRGTTAVWAGQELLAFGGVGSSRGETGEALTHKAWLYLP